MPVTSEWLTARCTPELHHTDPLILHSMSADIFTRAVEIMWPAHAFYTCIHIGLLTDMGRWWNLHRPDSKSIISSQPAFCGYFWLSPSVMWHVHQESPVLFWVDMGRAMFVDMSACSTCLYLHIETWSHNLYESTSKHQVEMHRPVSGCHYLDTDHMLIPGDGV